MEVVLPCFVIFAQICLEWLPTDPGRISPTRYIDSPAYLLAEHSYSEFLSSIFTIVRNQKKLLSIPSQFSCKSRPLKCNRDVFHYREVRPCYMAPKPPDGL